MLNILIFYCLTIHYVTEVKQIMYKEKDAELNRH